MGKTASALFLLFILAGLIFVLNAESNSVNLKLKVRTSVANIRSGPSLESKIIMQVKLGTVLMATGKEGNWYLVTLSRQDIEPALIGYIHQSIVEIMSEPESVSKPSKLEPREQPKEEISLQESELKQKPESKPELKPRQQSKDLYSKKMYIRASYSLGFLEETLKSSWQETIYHETANANIDYNIQKGNFFSAALGYRIYGPVSLELGVDITSRNMTGAYSASIPHPLLFGVPRDGKGVESYKLNEDSIYFALVYSLRSGIFGLDLSAGPAYILSKSKIISGITYADSYTYDSVTLSSNSTDVSKNVFGFNGGASILFYLTENFAVALNAHYISGKADLETGTTIPGLQVTLGGLKAGAGLKILF